MPLLLDEDPLSKAGGGTGFDLQNATTLFWKPVPVSLRQSDREEVSEDFTFRILTGHARNNHNLRILRIHISSDSDLFFLHSLEVSEEDFQSLKNEQGILVDFASFPGKIITLLDKCTAPQPTDTTRFQAVLAVRGAESIFKIVEINDFKQLPHITLAFRPGNDASVKQFLAFRLLEVKTSCTELTEGLQLTRAEWEGTQSQLALCQHQLAEVKEQYSRHLLEVQADFKTQRASAQEESLKDRSVAKEQHDRERHEQERKFREQIDTLAARVSELDVESRKLRENKYDLDSKVSELSHKLGSAEGSNRSLEEECARLKQLNQQLSSERHDRDIQMNEAKARLIALDEKTQAQTEIIEQQRSRMRELEASARQMESRCSDLRDVAAGHDQRAKDSQAEVVKGNAIIEKLMGEVKIGKEKVRRKQAIVMRQEEELQAREQALSSALRELQGLTSAVESARGERSGLGSENAELRAKLEESKSQLQSNEQMIRWLNQQVNDAQLQMSGAVSGSRYAFSRATPAALTAGPATGLPTSATPLAPRMLTSAPHTGGGPASRYTGLTSTSYGGGASAGSKPSTSSYGGSGLSYGVGGAGAAGAGSAPPQASAFKSFTPSAGLVTSSYGVAARSSYDEVAGGSSRAPSAGGAAQGADPPYHEMKTSGLSYGGGGAGASSYTGRPGDGTPYQPIVGSRASNV